MSLRAVQPWLMLAGMVCAQAGFALDPATEDRLSFMANGSLLSDDHGGAGGSVGWLHNFTDTTLTDAEVEYESLFDAHWTFGSLTAATGFGPPGGKFSLYAEAHEGSGDIGTKPFDYAVEAAGVARTFGSHFSMQLEDRQFDIGTSHGNLPKLSASVLWSPKLMTTVSYAYTVGGNLDTELLSVRIDAYSPSVNFLAGAAFGPGTPAVLNLATGNVQPGKRIDEGFVGLAKPLPRGTLTVVADYQDVAGFRRTTLTLSYIVPIGAGGHAK
jgi:hypothetical protein